MLQETVWELSNIKRPLRHVSAVLLLSVKEAATGGVFRNFAKFTGKHLCQSLFFNRVEGLFRTPPDDCFER